MKKDKFNKLININQIVVKKDYFLKNLKKFKEIVDTGEVKLIEKDNTAFVAIPLVKIKKFNEINYKGVKGLDKPSMEKAFQLNFVFKLYSLIHRKKFLFNDYPYKVLIYSFLNNNAYILKYLFNSIFNKENWSRAKNIEISYK